MALLEVKTEWAVYKDCFLQVARYQADTRQITAGQSRFGTTRTDLLQESRYASQEADLQRTRQ